MKHRTPPISIFWTYSDAYYEQFYFLKRFRLNDTLEDPAGSKYGMSWGIWLEVWNVVRDVQHKRIFGNPSMYSTQVPPYNEPALPKRLFRISLRYSNLQHPSFSVPDSFRKQELVVLECLGLLHEVPVTFEVLQSTGIGSTLMAIRIFADTLLLLVVVVSNCFVQGSELVLRQRQGAPVCFFKHLSFFVWFYLYIQYIHSASPWISTKWCGCGQALFNFVVDRKFTQHLNISDDQMSRFSGNYVAPAMADAGELVRFFSLTLQKQLLKHQHCSWHPSLWDSTLFLMSQMHIDTPYVPRHMFHMFPFSLSTFHLPLHVVFIPNFQPVGQLHCRWPNGWRNSPRKSNAPKHQLPHLPLPPLLHPLCHGLAFR